MLREARMRARIDISEIEAQTKIRAKYLRALENEEWSLLPGPTYVKSFLRTYAQALGLDARLLVEEYRLHHEGPTDVEMQPIAPAPQRRSRPIPGSGPGGGVPRTWITAGVVIVAIILVLAIIGSGGGGGSKKSGSTPTTTAPRGSTGPARPRAGAPIAARPARASLQLVPSGPVYVCLIGGAGRKLINGVILQPGQRQPTFHAKRFTVTLGNGQVQMRVNKKLQAVPDLPNPVGYVVTASGRHSLPAAQRPTCA